MIQKTYKVSRGWLSNDIRAAIGTGLLGSVSVEPLAEAAIAKGMPTFYGVRFVQRANANSTRDKRPQIF